MLVLSGWRSTAMQHMRCLGETLGDGTGVNGFCEASGLVSQRNIVWQAFEMLGTAFGQTVCGHRHSVKRKPQSSQAGSWRSLSHFVSQKKCCCQQFRFGREGYRHTGVGPIHGLPQARKVSLRVTVGKCIQWALFFARASFADRGLLTVSVSHHRVAPSPWPWNHKKHPGSPWPMDAPACGGTLHRTP